jgi:prevent-host-death family protein
MHFEVSVTELARNLADYLNRVAYRGEEFTIVRGNKPLAELRPRPMGRRLGDLPALLAAAPHLGPEEALAFERDMELARLDLDAVPLEDPWESS